MTSRIFIALITLLFTSPICETALAQTDDYTPDAAEVLWLIRGEKLDLILPSAMRENDVDELTPIIITLYPGDWVDIYGAARVKHILTTSAKVRIVFFVAPGVLVWRKKVAESEGVNLLDSFADPRRLYLTSRTGDVVQIDGPFRYTFKGHKRGYRKVICYLIQASVEIQIQRELARNKTPNTHQKEKQTMSELRDYGYNPAKAAAFNARAADSFGWRGQIPKGALEAIPCLHHPVDSIEFAEAVHDLQRILFRSDKDDWDGKLGRGTWGEILEKYDRVLDGQNYVVYNGRRLVLPEGRGYIVTCFDERGGYDLHREGDWQRGRAKGLPLSIIVYHWAGRVFTNKTLHNVFENAIFNEEGVIIEDPRNVSSHGGIELLPDGTVRVCQMIDLFHRTWHGGLLNPTSVGFDILWDPREKYYKRYRDRGLDVKWIKNPTSPRRGDKMIGTLPTALEHGVRNFTEDLLKVLDLGPPLIPLGHDGFQITGAPYDGVIEKEAFRDGRVRANVVGHHHGDKGKWDIGCWFPFLFPQFYGDQPVGGGPVGIGDEMG